jgi:NADPH:quinone reductase-like Zn-dependent oxidoreductase
VKAIVYRNYGSPDVLKLEEVEQPTPNDNEVLVKVKGSSVNAMEWHFMRGKPLFMRLMASGFLKPKNNILGADLAGIVESVGKDIENFKVGDEVFGYKGMSLGFGAYAEYVILPQHLLVHKPENTPFDEAAGVPLAGLTALQGLRDEGKIQAGDNVLIVGASGGVGSFAVQIAKSFGAEVTAVCSTRNVEIARACGADHVIDYKKENFADNGLQYDLIFAVNGYNPIATYQKALTPKGRYVCAGGTMQQNFQALMRGPGLSKKGNQKLGGMNTRVPNEDLLTLKDMLAEGKIKTVVDRKYSLSEVPAAIGYIEEGHAQGKVLITYP